MIAAPGGGKGTQGEEQKAGKDGLKAPGMLRGGPADAQRLRVA
jgi:hypothetical protein